MTAFRGDRGEAGPKADVLEVADLTVSFPTDAGTVAAVRGMSYAVAPGEVLGIVGESGAGKSVSALAVMGLLAPTARVAGSVRFRRRELLGLDDRDLSAIRGKGMAMVFQDPASALTPTRPVGDQIAEAVRIHRRVGRQEAMQRAVELLDLVRIPGAARRAASFPHELSGGMRQRVMIAMAMANDPELIIADEPTSALDVTVQAQVLEVLRTAREATGAAIVLLSHDLGVVAGLADRVVVMYAGRPVETGSTDDVLTRPVMPYTVGLLGSLPRIDAKPGQPLAPLGGSPPSPARLPPGCAFAPRCPLSVENCTRVEPELESVGGRAHLAACHRSHESEALRLASGGFSSACEERHGGEQRASRERRGVVLEVTGLAKRFPLTKGSVLRRQVGTVAAVDGVSLYLREGETLGVVGESGSGKTALVREVLALAAPEEGSVVVFGKDTATLDAATRRRLRRDLAIVFQDPMGSLDPRMTVSDIVGEGLRIQGATRERIASEVRDVLGVVGLDGEDAGRYPHQLSGGQCQRVAIARALAPAPRVVVLDEPVSALDVSVRAGILNLLGRLKASLGLAYLFVAHDLAVVRHVADRVAVMYLGRIVEVGAADAVFERPAHPYTEALLSAIPLVDPERERKRRRVILEGEMPTPGSVLSGCRFRGRCPKFAALDADRRQRCVEEEPGLSGQGDDHQAACHYPTSTESTGLKAGPP